MINPADFLTLANQLQASTFEAERRTCIGRSYYALYNLLIMPLSDKGVPFKNNADDHGRLVYYLTKCGDRIANNMAMALKQLRNSRNDADYRLKLTIDVSQSQMAYRRAESSVNDFNSLLAGQVQRIADSMRYLPPFRKRRS